MGAVPLSSTSELIEFSQPAICLRRFIHGKMLFACSLWDSVTHCRTRIIFKIEWCSKTLWIVFHIFQVANTSSESSRCSEGNEIPITAGSFRSLHIHAFLESKSSWSPSAFYWSECWSARTRSIFCFHVWNGVSGKHWILRNPAGPFTTLLNQR